MILAGDEFGRTQSGNNNGYCQDNEISWVDWEQAASPEGQALQQFVRDLIAMRKKQPLLRRDSYRDGMIINWLNPNGGNQTPEQWEDAGATSIALELHRSDLQNDTVWDTMIIAFNAHDGDVTFVLPQRSSGVWTVALDTGANGSLELDLTGDLPKVQMPARSLAIFV
jgi:glycogen operon protein